jgi:ATP-dependent Clp protease protease subunit
MGCLLPHCTTRKRCFVRKSCKGFLCQNEAKELARVRAYVYSQVAKKTGQSAEKVTKDLNRIKRFSSQEALDYGLIDRIIRPRRIKPDARRQETAGVGLG